MSSVLTDLGVVNPVLAAPMAGGATTVELVAAAESAGSLGFLAAGYLGVEQVAALLGESRARCSRFGVNLFAPNPVPISDADYRAYSDRLRPLAEQYGVELPPEPISDDDQFAAKVDLLLNDPVPMVSFTFGIPPREVIASLRRRGTVVVQSVTNAEEARAAVDAGVDALAPQGCFAGGHSATLTPGRWPAPVPTAELVSSIRAAVSVPIVAGGGLSTPSAVREVLTSGAAGALVGTALLRCPEAGTSATHRAALADGSRTETVLTRAFTGRPARGIRNGFIDRFDAVAPAGYPALHHLTSALRKAAASAGDADAVHLWAGTGFRNAVEVPAAAVLQELASAL